MPRVEAPEGYSIAILHTHTNRSDGLVSPEKVVTAAYEIGATVLAITDHDTLLGIAEAKRKAAELGIELVVGEEIQTKGVRHILGLFLEERIPPSQPVTFTIEEIKRQGGLVIIPHPKPNGIRSRDSLKLNEIAELIQNQSVDGIEVLYYDMRLTQEHNAELMKFYELNNKKLGAKLGSPDSHFGAKDIASNYTIFPGSTAKDLYCAIKDRTTQAIEGVRNKVPKIDAIRRNFKAIVILSLKRKIKLSK